MTNLDPNFLPSKDDNELADLQHGRPIDDPLYILVQQEWQRREMATKHELDMALLKNQHKLNLEILNKQSSLTKLSITIGFVGIIIGTILGAYIPVMLSEARSENPKELLKSQAQKQASESSSLHRKEISEPLVQKETASKIE